MVSVKVKRQGVVIHERKKLARASDELKRVQMLKEIRSGRWNAAARLDQAVRDWLLQGGIPSGCRIESVEDAPLSELLTKADNGRIDAALDRCRLKLRERAADLHRVRSAPWPVAVAKAAVKSQIDAIADAAAPDIDRAVEHNLPVIFATTHLAALVRNLDAPGAATISEVPDAFGTLVWLCREQVQAKIFAALDEAADDSNALSEQQRQEAEATITADMLAIERLECAAIWHAESDGEVFDFRQDTSPQAVLGVRLITAPRAAASPGSSIEHALDIVGGR